MTKRTTIREKDVQLALYEYWSTAGLSTQREIHTPVGYIDFIRYLPDGSSIMTEVKETSSIKHAIGQIQSYSIYRPCTHYEVVYFCYDPYSKKATRNPDISHFSHTVTDSSGTAKRIRIKNIYDYISINYILDHSALTSEEQSDDACTETLTTTAHLTNSNGQQPSQSYTELPTWLTSPEYLHEPKMSTGQSFDSSLF